MFPSSSTKSVIDREGATDPHTDVEDNLSETAWSQRRTGPAHFRKGVMSGMRFEHITSAHPHQCLSGGRPGTLHVSTSSLPPAPAFQAPSPPSCPGSCSTWRGSMVLVEEVLVLCHCQKPCPLTTKLPSEQSVEHGYLIWGSVRSR